MKPGGAVVATTDISATNCGLIPAALADLNHDGYLDLVTTCYGNTNTNPATVVVFLGKGDGTFQPAQSYLPGNSSFSAAVVDIDLDGYPDLVVTRSDSMSTLLGNGDGTFRTGSTIVSATDLSVVRTADVNGDGKPDLVFLRGSTPGVEVLLGNGDGTFQTSSPSSMKLNGLQYDLLVADFNGDGLPDLATANRDTNTVSVTINQGGGTFGVPAVYTSYGAQNLAVADLNGDGKPDLLVGSVGFPSFDLMLGNGDGTFLPARTIATKPGPPQSGPTTDAGSYSLAVCDFDGDGHPDVISVEGGYAVSVMLSNGDGTFRPPLLIPIFLINGPLVLGDLDHDGIVDVVAGMVGFVRPYLGKLSPVFTVSANPNPTNVGQSFTVTVSSNYPDATGIINLSAGFTQVSGTLVNGVATIPLTNPPRGIYQLGGTYGGDGKYASTVLPASLVTVQQAVTASLTVSPNPAIPGQLITLTAAATPATSGLVSFFDGATPLCQQTAYSASTCKTLLPAGRHFVTARFAGAYGYLPASATMTVDVIAASNGQLAPGSVYSAASTPTGTVVGDLNGDGILDFAILDTGSKDVTVYLGKGQGSFQPARQNALTFVPGAIVSGVFDGYGYTDLAVTDPADNAIAVLQSYDDGIYFPIQGGGGPISAAIPVGTQPVAIATGDFNGDGATDLITANAGSDDVSLVLSLGYPGILQHAVNVTAGHHPDAVVTADFDGDGKADFAVANRDDDTVMTFLGNGDGTFRTPIVTATGSGPIALAAGDLDGDGKTDLVVVNGGSNHISILLGNGDGTLRSLTSYSSGTSPSSAALVDLDGDEKLDLAIATSSGLLVFHGNGDGTFASPSSYPQYSGVASVAAGAFSGDGRMDLLVTLPTSGSIDFILNGTAATTTTLSVTPSSITMSAKVTLTATVSPAMSGGAVAFFDGTTQVGAAIVSNGSGSFATTLLMPGTHSLSARFAGGPGYGSSISGTVLLRVSPVPATGLSAPIRQSFAANSLSINLLPGDFNKDGIDDFVLWEATGNSLPTILGNGDGTFHAPAGGTGYTFGGGTAVGGDFNNDGNPDVAFIRSDVFITLGDGTGNFSGGSSFSNDLLNSPAAIATADFNGDGRLDLITLDTAIPTAYLQLGTGDGTFQLARTLPVGSKPVLVTTGDFNEDGKADIVVLNSPVSATNTATIGELDFLAGRGDGTFTSPVTLSLPPQPLSIAVADFNNDGHADIAVVNTGSNLISVLLGSGNGTFALPLTYLLTAPPAQILAADMDGDGNVDLVVRFAAAAPAFAVMYGAGNGNFGRTVAYPDLIAPSGIAVGDVNGDGRLDVILSAPNTVTVFPGAAGSISTSQGSGQSATVGTSFAANLTVQAPAGTQVTFAAPAENGNTPAPGGSFPGSLTAVTVTADASGVATAPPFTANGKPGNYSVLAWARGVAGVVSFSLTNQTGPAVSVIGGIGLHPSTVVNTAFSSFVYATVQDSYGNGISGVTITFTAPSSGASCTFLPAGMTVTAVTNSSGAANVALGQANGMTGSYNVVASVAGVAATGSIPMSNLAAPTITVLSGNNQSATLNVAFGAPLVAKVVDALGHPAQFASVTFTAPADGASAIFGASGSNSIVTSTDQNGVASAGAPTGAGGIGSYAVTATVMLYGSNTTFSLTNTANAGGPPQPQFITFPTIATHSIASPTFTLMASTSSGLPVIFSVIAGPATISGNSLTATAAGYITVQAAQPGDGTYSAAPSVSRQFYVSPIPSVLTVTKTHVGNFAQNQLGVTYTITVANAANAGPTSQTVTVAEAPPTGLTITSMSGGPTWSCTYPNQCYATTVLPPGSSYPTLTVTANVASNAPALLTNQVTVSGGGSNSATASDPAAVVPFTCAVSGGSTVSVTDVQMVLNEALGAAQASHDLTHDGAVTVADLEKVINATLTQSCSY